MRRLALVVLLGLTACSDEPTGLSARDEGLILQECEKRAVRNCTGLLAEIADRWPGCTVEQVRGAFAAGDSRPNDWGPTVGRTLSEIC